MKGNYKTNPNLYTYLMEVPGGLVARVQVNINTLHARWNTQGIPSLPDLPWGVTGKWNDGRFVPYSKREADYIAANFNRKRKAWK